MGNAEKLLNQIMELKFTEKSLQRQARKGEKEKAEKLKIKKAVEKGNMDGARILIREGRGIVETGQEFGAIDAGFVTYSPGMQKLEGELGLELQDGKHHNKQVNDGQVEVQGAHEGMGVGYNPQ